MVPVKFVQWHEDMKSLSRRYMRDWHLLICHKLKTKHPPETVFSLPFMQNQARFVPCYHTLENRRQACIWQRILVLLMDKDGHHGSRCRRETSEWKTQTFAQSIHIPKGQRREISEIWQWAKTADILLLGNHPFQWL